MSISGLRGFPVKQCNSRGSERVDRAQETYQYSADCEFEDW